MKPSSIIYVTAPWCTACHATLPLVKTVSAQKGVPIEILDLGVPEDEARAVPLSVTALPTIVGDLNGRELWRLTGAVGRAALDAVLH